MRALLVFALGVASVAAGQTLTRGPYLQLASPTGVTVVFRTGQSGIGRVRYGLAGQPLSQVVSEAQPSTEHVLRLSGLTPATRYEYAVELDSATLASGPTCRFRTHPPPGTVEAFRLFAWGDSGTAGAGQLRVANRMAAALNDAAFSLILGDIIYPSGEPQDYDPKFFRPYAELARRMVIWPIVGNHDVAFDPTGGPWLDAFHTPANNPLSTELYYSFDYANVHVVVLDTHVHSFSPGSAQLQWAAADLAASTATWKLVAFHVPPYSGGTHTDSASVKANILPVLEAAGVDLVFAGHSHVYERTYLLKQHAIVQNDPSSYSKPTRTTGTLYVVSGTAGQSGALANPAHPMMAFQLGSVLGTSVVDFNGDTAHGYFLKDDGSAVDTFRLVKGSDTRPPELVAARALTATSVEVAFSEPVQAGTGPLGAERLAAWSITPALAITGASLTSDLRTVRLTTAPHASGSYTVAVANVGDRAPAPNTLSMGSAAYSFQPGGAQDAGAVDGGAPSGPVDGGLLFVNRLTPLRWLVGTAAAPAAWNGFAFDDSLWSPGRQPIGYGEPGLATTVSMGQAVTLFTRSEFDLFVDAASVRGLTLEVDYDDGFVAFLNGREIARRGVPANHSHTTLASGHESGTSEVFPLAGAEAFLRSGDNFLSIEVHNTAVTSSDLFLEARLWANAVVLPSDGGPRLGDDAGTLDAGPLDAGALEELDAGTLDAGSLDAGAMEALDGGAAGPDGGSIGVDGGVDAGVRDAQPTRPCGCGAIEGSILLALLGLIGLTRRREISRSPGSSSS
ncbi:MAG: metallophosphoesterase family protein [Myxococcaceae bacterium]|nr:metallophosphoesterase family protein [Myxococcaceae bacterium]